MEFTEAESNMNDLVSEYQQYQDATAEDRVRALQPGVGAQPCPKLLVHFHLLLRAVLDATTQTLRVWCMSRCCWCLLARSCINAVLGFMSDLHLRPPGGGRVRRGGGRVRHAGLKACLREQFMQQRVGYKICPALAASLQAEAHGTFFVRRKRSSANSSTCRDMCAAACHATEHFRQHGTY